MLNGGSGTPKKNRFRDAPLYHQGSDYMDVYLPQGYLCLFVFDSVECSLLRGLQAAAFGAYTYLDIHWTIVSISKRLSPELLSLYTPRSGEARDLDKLPNVQPCNASFEQLNKIDHLMGMRQYLHWVQNARFDPREGFCCHLD